MTDTKSTSPLAQPSTWGLVAEAYAAEVVPIFEEFAREALRLAEVRGGMRVVDVAAGPGTLSLLAARMGARVHAIDFTPEMIERLRARAADLDGIDAIVGDGQALPYEDGAFDAAFSMFGLMFFPDRGAGFRELRRVLRPGARAVVSSWVDFALVPEIGAIFGALEEVAPRAETSDEPQPAMPLSDPALCVREMSEAGFTEVRVEVHEAVEEYDSVGAMIGHMGRASAPVVLLRRALGDAWPDLEARWIEAATAKLGAGALSVRMPAHLTVGVR